MDSCLTGSAKESLAVAWDKSSSGVSWDLVVAVSSESSVEEGWEVRYGRCAAATEEAEKVAIARLLVSGMAVMVGIYIL